MAGVHVAVERRLEGDYAVYLDVVEEAVYQAEDDGDLLFERQRDVLPLFQHFGGALSALQLAAGRRVQVRRAELGEGDQLAVLRQVQPQRSRHRAHRARLGGAAHARHGQARVHRRTDAAVEQLRLEVYLPVRYRDHVRGDVGGDVARLRFDYRQRGYGAAAMRRVHLRGALEQAAVQIEDVAGIRLAPRRAAQQQRHFAVRPGVLGEVVVNHEGVLAPIHEVLRHGAAGVWREILHRRGVGGVGGYHDGMLHRAVRVEQAYRLGDFARLLPNGDVDADEVAAALVDDGVERDGGFAGGAVADDQLALPAPNGNHRVYRLDARLNGGVDRHARGDVRRDDFDRAAVGGADRPFAVDGLSERVDDAGEQVVPDGDFHDAAGGADAGSLFDGERVAHDDRADGVFFEVQRHAHDAAFEFEQLGVGGARKPVYLGDAVADLYHGALVDRFELLIPVFDLAPDHRSYILPSDRHFGLPVNGARSVVAFTLYRDDWLAFGFVGVWRRARVRLAALRQLPPHVLKAGSSAAVENPVSDSDYHAAENLRIHAAGEPDFSAVHVGERALHLLALTVIERDGGDGFGARDAVVGVQQLLKPVRDCRQQVDEVSAGQQQHEVDAQDAHRVVAPAYSAVFLAELVRPEAGLGGLFAPLVRPESVHAPPLDGQKPERLLNQRLLALEGYARGGERPHEVLVGGGLRQQFEVGEPAFGVVSLDGDFERGLGVSSG